MHARAADAQASRIGPNAITRVAEVLHARFDTALVQRIFASAGIAHHLRAPPESMVDEHEVALLHRRLRETLGTQAAREIGRDAGHRTGDYLLARRIPKPVQWLLRFLPASLASRILLAAITRHAWTFAGSGEFSVISHAPLRLSIRDNPLCRNTESDQPLCDFYSATFERLYRVLVHPRTRVEEIACEASGAAACVFELDWSTRAPG